MLLPGESAEKGYEKVRPAISLRAYCIMSSTDLTYHAAYLRAYWTMSGTDLAHAAISLRVRCGMSGTDLPYGPICPIWRYQLDGKYAGGGERKDQGEKPPNQIPFQHLKPRQHFRSNMSNQDLISRVGMGLCEIKDTQRPFQYCLYQKRRAFVFDFAVELRLSCAAKSNANAGRARTRIAVPGGSTDGFATSRDYGGLLPAYARAMRCRVLTLARSVVGAYARAMQYSVLTSSARCTVVPGRVCIQSG
eukprot:3175521-Rhodomonas_salina.5